MVCVVLFSWCWFGVVVVVVVCVVVCVCGAGVGVVGVLTSTRRQKSSPSSLNGLQYSPIFSGLDEYSIHVLVL